MEKSKPKGGAKSKLYALLSIIFAVEAAIAIAWFVYAPITWKPSFDLATGLLIGVPTIGLALFSSIRSWRRPASAFLIVFSVLSAGIFVLLSGEAQRWAMLVCFPIVLVFAIRNIKQFR